MGKKRDFYVQKPKNECGFSSSEYSQYFMGAPFKTVEPVDEDKKIAIQKLMVGHYIEKIPEDCKKRVIYVLQGNGVYEQRINKLGSFTTRLVKVDIPGLKSDLLEGWQLNVPKIPVALLGTTVSFFRKIYTQYSSEVFLQFYWDIEKSEYIIHCPKQTVSGASVRYDNDELFSDQNKILVFEIHSHGQMSAFFSGTDDGDEKADRFYGVIGNINQFFPELKLRISVGGIKTSVDVNDIFDLDEEMYHAETYPKDWAERIQKSKAKMMKGGKWSRVRQRRDGNFSTIEGENPDQMDLVSQFESEDHVRSSYECLTEDWDMESLYGQATDTNEKTDGDNVGGAKGYYLREGSELYWMEGGVKYHIEDKDKEQAKEDTNPNLGEYDYRGKRF